MNMPLWFSNLLFWSAQVGLLVLAGALLVRLFRIGEPRVLLAYWRALLAVSFALPVLQPWRRPQAFGTILVVPEVADVPLPPPSAPVPHWHLPSAELVAQLLGGVILLGILLRFAFLLAGLRKFRRLRQSSAVLAPSSEAAVALDDMRNMVKASAEFRLSTQVDSPVTFGFASPVILLPERFASLDSRFQSAIACHELLHVRRRDWAHHLGEECLRAIFWFHPAIVWLISRVRLAREQVVDREVLRLTRARKPYLEALLEFAGVRPRAAIPAPPFLAERQLVERVALMLKEVRMSRRRSIVSLGVMSCCLLVVAALSARTFPLTRAPLQSAPQTGVTGGVAGGVSSGVAGEIRGGVSGGIAGGVAAPASSDIPTVDYSTIWIDTVKRGPMLRQVRGLGTLVHAEDSSGLVAKVALPAVMTVDVHPNESATIDTGGGKGLVKGHVIGLNAANGDTRFVIFALDGALPGGFIVDARVDATIDIEKLDNVLNVGRPVHGAANTVVPLFRINADGKEATRVNVKLGRSSVNTIEILDGLKEGDKIILSDMSSVDNADRIRLTDDQHAVKH